MLNISGFHAGFRHRFLRSRRLVWRQKHQNKTTIALVAIFATTVICFSIGFASFSRLVDLDGKIFVLHPPNQLYESIAHKSLGVDADLGIQFNRNTDPSGVYTLSAHANDPNPVYYFRGEVSDNHVLFAGFCWKAVRTTTTGGVKVIYNGSPDANGACTATGEATEIGNSQFSPAYNSPAYAGYMYGEVYPRSYFNPSSDDYLFGKSVTWKASSASYTLVGTQSTLDDRHHFTCVTTGTGSCAQVAYVHYLNGTVASYITLKNGVSTPSAALTRMQANTTSSTIKTVIDNWYSENLVDYTAKLEDAPFCNDRSMQTNTNGWIANGGKLNEYLNFGAYGRNAQHYAPSVDCPNKNDAFTVDDAVNGNGALTYPIGLLTADEMALAGMSWSGYYANNYLKIGPAFWSASPREFHATDSRMFSASSSGVLGSGGVDNAFGVRPVISLAPGRTILSGSGTATDPWVVE